MTAPLLQIERLKVHFPVQARRSARRLSDSGARPVVKAVDDVSLAIQEAEVVGIVGESGCGKTTLARAVLRLVPVTEGRVLFEGDDLAAVPPRRLRVLRPRLQMVFQDPYASLNPRMTVFDALAEPLRAHGLVPRTDIAAEVAAIMERVGLARRFVRKYPHEFSGGQRQRIAIARALALRPRLIFADEPVSALDVSVQAQILNLLQGLCREDRLTMVLISHDLAVVKYLAQRIAVMYLGHIVESGEAEAVFREPVHPYTRALVSAIPHPDPDREAARRRVLLPGEPPSPLHPPKGCPFHPRCPYAAEECSAARPGLEERRPGRQAACFRLDSIDGGQPRHGDA
ncbi:MAG: ATP-binding cassette domain-containing protein [Candidatus Hydrogenedentes bacterium]|nr:ATP-binding cassette domain-containing protein [Candidatus Hydrogenedentota bacterium]